MFYNEPFPITSSSLGLKFTVLLERAVHWRIVRYFSRHSLRGRSNECNEFELIEVAKRRNLVVTPRYENALFILSSRSLLNHTFAQQIEDSVVDHSSWHNCVSIPLVCQYWEWIDISKNFCILTCTSQISILRINLSQMPIQGHFYSSAHPTSANWSNASKRTNSPVPRASLHLQFKTKKYGTATQLNSTSSQ